MLNVLVVSGNKKVQRDNLASCTMGQLGRLCNGTTWPVVHWDNLAGCIARQLKFTGYASRYLVMQPAVRLHNRHLVMQPGKVTHPCRTLIFSIHGNHKFALPNAFYPAIRQSLPAPKFPSIRYCINKII